MNAREYVLQMCRPVMLQVNTLADGQLGTGWPRCLPPGERIGEENWRVCVFGGGGLVGLGGGRMHCRG